MALVSRAMANHVSTRSGSKLSGQARNAPGTQFDLNRQMEQSSDPQGMYIVGADGSAYGFTNDHYPEEILPFMNAGLKRYKAQPPKSVVITTAETQARWSFTPAVQTQVLQVFARIPDVPSGCSELNKGIGRDFCWVYADEINTLAARLAQTPVGGKLALPASLLRRIARFHLVDDVRGTPDMWQAEHLRKLDLHAHVLPPAAGDRKKLARIAFDGHFALQKRSGRQGYTGKIEGVLHFDSATRQIVRFRALADGQAWGAGTFTPNQPPGRYRLLVAFTDTRDAAARIVPPEEVATAGNDRQYHRP